MPLTTAGRNFLAASIVADGPPTPFDNSNAYLGSGDDDTAFNASQTDLIGSNKLRKGMEVGYPQRTDNVLTFRSLFGTSEANWDWEEWAVFNASSSGVMLSRKAETLGSKTSAQSWLLTATLTVSIGS